MVEVIVEDEEGGEAWETEAYVNGGCAFVDDDGYLDVNGEIKLSSGDGDERCKVLVRYKEACLQRFGIVNERPVAVIAGAVGQGRYILSGVHPELKLGETALTREEFVEGKRQNDDRIRLIELMAKQLDLQS